MAKLTKVQLRKHNRAVELVENGRPLEMHERAFIAHNWMPSAGDVTTNDAFFTPWEYATSFANDSWSGNKCNILDLGGGIGGLSFAHMYNAWWGESELALHDDHVAIIGLNMTGAMREMLENGQLQIWHRHAPCFVIVEQNEKFIEVGKRVMPEATWIHGSFLDEAVQEEIAKHGPYTGTISNPPYSKIDKEQYGSVSALRVARKFADAHVFLVPLIHFGLEVIKTNRFNSKVQQWPVVHSLTRTHMDDNRIDYVYDTYIRDDCWLPAISGTGYSIEHDAIIRESAYSLREVSGEFTDTNIEVEILHIYTGDITHNW